MDLPTGLVLGLLQAGWSTIKREKKKKKNEEYDKQTKGGTNRATETEHDKEEKTKLKIKPRKIEKKIRKQKQRGVPS